VSIQNTPIDRQENVRDVIKQVVAGKTNLKLDAL
jgi:hypothetical protein